AAAALTLALAACSSGSDGGSSTHASAAGGGAASPTAAGGGGSSTTVDQANFSFDPATLSVKAGSTITVDNTTPSTTHTFTIEGSDVDATLQGGQSQEVTIDLQPGTYTLICRFHRAQGMTGTITVT
ncbi:MAG: cupredoxin domain-containing protein, partial [Candidatus Velamenicoccus archaeovorus]